MTTIVYKDGVLATDTRLSAGGTIITDDNIKGGKTDKWMFAAAGDAGLCDSFLTWGNTNFIAEAKPVTVTHIEDFNDFQAIAISKDLDVYLYDINLNSIFCGKVKEVTLGSGGDFARGALAMGASIEDAVKVAMNLDTNSGGRVAIFKFSNTRSK